MRRCVSYMFCMTHILRKIWIDLASITFKKVESWIKMTRSNKKYLLISSEELI
jgi:hypothetical protein